jgi:hypothetical protein
MVAMPFAPVVAVANILAPLKFKVVILFAVPIGVLSS